MDLQTFFRENPVCALGFSGGVDSSYLLYAGLHYGARIQPYFIKTPFQPQFELMDAKRMARELHVNLIVLPLPILTKENVTANEGERCYHCKRTLFGALKERAMEDGFTVLLDGTNASDDAGDRPGMRALGELSVRSPLRECGITKDQVRALSKAAGLFTWDKPAYACLATRIPTGTPLTEAALYRVEKGEEALFALGFSDLRIRCILDMGKIELPRDQMACAIQMQEEIRGALAPYFREVVLDLTPR